MPEPQTPPNPTLTCPICSEPATDDFAPFCSKRCKTIDLGRWAGGQYRISRPIQQADLEQGD